MHRFAFVILAAFVILSAFPVWAQESGEIDITSLADHIYKLSYDGGGYTVKVIASVGDDGLLLVDTGQKDAVEKLTAALRTLTDENPKIIISTHEHVEHLEGNAAFGKNALIIGHRILRSRMQSGIYLFDEFPDEALPDLTFSDSLSLYFNGEEIKLIAAPGSHSDNDIIVWFTKSKIACVGAICNGHDFPSVDRSGDVMQYATVAQRVIDMLPQDARIVPGHGADCSMDEFRTFHDMLIETTERVRTEMAAGKDLAAMQADSILKDWASYAGSYTSMNQWIKYLSEGIAGVERRTPVWEPMYYAIKEKGPQAAVEYYFKLKSDEPDTYEFKNTDLVFIAYKLFTNGRTSESISFFERSIAEYPDGPYTELSHSLLGQAYEAAGDKVRALKNYKKVLESDPENAEALQKVSELKQD
jgi:cyclase